MINIGILKSRHWRDQLYYMIIILPDLEIIQQQLTYMKSKEMVKDHQKH